MAEKESLKDSNIFVLTSYVVAHSLLLAWMVIGQPTSLKAASEIGMAEWSKAGAALVLILLVRILNRLGGSMLKARLVFWRYRYPLPGYRAFSKLASTDHRIDAHRLQERLGGSFPEHPEQQNKEWYRIYQRHSSNLGVESSHKEYLLFRDTCWLTILLTTGGCALLWRTIHNPWLIMWYLCANVTLYIIARLASVRAGERFVTSVLAAESAAMDQIPPTTASLITG